VAKRVSANNVENIIGENYDERESGKKLDMCSKKKTEEYKITLS
jgi:hypothetical protein